MITLNMENGKEVAMNWIVIAVEFVKSFFKHLANATVVFGAWTGLSLLLVVMITQDVAAGLALSSSILAAVNAPAVVSFIVSVALLQYLKEKGVF